MDCHKYNANVTFETEKPAKPFVFEAARYAALEPTQNRSARFPGP